jgi:hypothetical protein
VKRRSSHVIYEKAPLQSLQYRALFVGGG